MIGRGFVERRLHVPRVDGAATSLRVIGDITLFRGRSVPPDDHRPSGYPREGRKMMKGGPDKGPIHKEGRKDQKGSFAATRGVAKGGREA